MARMQRSLFAQLNALAEEISQSSVKVAAEKSANPVPADPGGYQGASSHPSAHIDNRVQDATEGARASEYEADVKEQQGAVSVNNTPDLPQEGRQDDVQLNIGTNAASTGEDPAAEKDFKGTKDDPGTTHPAKTNDGEKYSAVSFKEARENCTNLGNDILANLINFGTAKLSPAEKAAELPEAFKDKMKGDDKSNGKLKGDQHKLDTDNDGKIEGSDLAALRNGKEAAYKAGYELAAKLGIEKAAAEAAVQEICANTLRDTDEMADIMIGFLSTKKAESDLEDDAAEGEDHTAPADAESGANDAPPAPAVEEAAMPPEAGLDGGASPSGDEAVQELAMALEELGIPPEALLEALAGGGAGGDPAAMGGDPSAMGGMDPSAMGGDPSAMGGMDPAAAGGLPPEMAPKMAAAKELNAIGRSVINFKRAGRFQVKEARTKRSRELRDMMKQHVIELVNR